MNVEIEVNGEKRIVQIEEPTVKHEQQLRELIRGMMKDGTMSDWTSDFKLTDRVDELLRELCPFCGTPEFGDLKVIEKYKLNMALLRRLMGSDDADFTTTSSRQ